MKWPEQLTIVRHGESYWNGMKSALKGDPLWIEFLNEYDMHFGSQKSLHLAREVLEKYPMPYGDHNTPLTKTGEMQAEATGKALSEIIGVPHVIFVSPYDRTMQTLENMKKSWPALKSVKMVEDENIREQEHGIELLYNDWRIFYTFHPEQKSLYDLEGPYWYRYPQGESAPDVRERNKLWITTLIREYSEQQVLEITHHLNILAQRAQFERLTEEQFIDLDQNHKPVNCGVTIYRGNPSEGTGGHFKLEIYNKKLY